MNGRRNNEVHAKLNINSIERHQRFSVLSIEGTIRLLECAMRRKKFSFVRSTPPLEKFLAAVLRPSRSIVFMEPPNIHLWDHTQREVTLGM
uniref:Uncharacterized protein n=1 Tax=Romanomermis culicivorax TaxID=13658 RepID=A0A915JTT1_ROMCU